MPPKRILIVEDDALLAMSIEQAVEDLGHSVDGPYKNLSDGLYHARIDQFDFALLDFNLGNGTDAIPIAQELARRGISYCFTTSTAPWVIRQSLPLAIVLPKPIRLGDLERVLPQ